MERNNVLLKGNINQKDLIDYTEIIYKFLKDKECINVPKRVAFKVAGILEKKDISFSFKNEPKKKWILFHYQYCNCKK
tara:strand:- start:22 stop:255 length:234 start_codon:yes stop_codon:yes gene_type:complete